MCTTETVEMTEMFTDVREVDACEDRRWEFIEKLTLTIIQGRIDAALACDIVSRIQVGPLDLDDDDLEALVGSHADELLRMCRQVFGLAQTLFYVPERERVATTMLLNMASNYQVKPAAP